MTIIRDLRQGIIGIILFFTAEREQGHGIRNYLRISGFLPQEYSFWTTATIFPNIFILFPPTIAHGDMP
jgi:hypothetical protein